MTFAAMKLYQSNTSPNSRRIRVYLAEKGIAIAMIHVDLAAREQFSEAYAAINPRQVVPTLVLEDGTAIGEVPAIWRFIEELQPEPPLLGATAWDKALITMWERRMELEGLAAVMETMRNQDDHLEGRAIAGPHDYDQIPQLVARGRKRIMDFYDDLDERLEDSPYVGGDSFSIADITALITCDFSAQAVGLAVPADHTITRRWYEAIAKRPSFKR